MSSERTNFEPGSFRDPDGRVFYRDQKVFRALKKESAHRHSSNSEFQSLLRLLEEKKFLLPSKMVEWQAFGLDLENQDFHSVIETERVEFVTYPYEWSFSMLKDAALLTLEILEICLSKNFILKDATSFNILFHQNKPVFIDTTSIVDYREGSPWVAYSQFCRSFLFPLVLKAYRNIDFQPYIQAGMGEIQTKVVKNVFGITDIFKPGIFKDVFLQAFFEKQFASAKSQTKKDLLGASFSKVMILKNISRLKKIILNLKAPAESAWSEYSKQNSYSEEELRQKKDFVESSLSKLRPQKVIDLGSNTGIFSKLAEKYSETVLSIDSDADCVDAIYRKEISNPKRSVLLANWAKPTPPMGWNLKERRSLLERVKQSDFLLALALIHHLRITEGIPLYMIVESFVQISSNAIIEWVDRKDEMAEIMLSGRDDVFSDYSYENFENYLSEHFEVVKTLSLKNGARKLIEVRKKKS